MKRRNSKKTGVIALIAGLSSVTLVSIGFASWVISGGVSTSIEGDIVAEDISDEAYLVKNKSVSYPTGYSAIYFGCDEGSSSFANPWLTNETNKCNLNATVTFFVSNLTANNKDSENNPIVEVTFSEEQDSVWDDCVDAEYVVAPTFSEMQIAANETTVGNLTGRVVTVSLAFNWGEHFGGDNPYIYYNSHDMDDEVTEGTTYAEDAKSSLKDLYKLSTKSFVITIRTGNKIS